MKQFSINQIALAVYLLSTVARTEDCGQQELINCSKQIQVLTETSEFNFVDKKEDLDKICPDLHIGLQCIRSYTRRCMSQHQRDHFNKLYHGTNEMIHELCQEGTYQEDFLKYAPCMRKIKKDYDMCSMRYQKTMSKLSSDKAAVVPSTTTTTTTLAPVTSLLKRQQDKQHSNSIYVSLETQTILPIKNATGDHASDEEEDQIKTVCCAFHKYMECSETAVRKACDNETAEFTRKFLDKMLSSLIRMHCTEHESRQCDEITNAAIPIVLKSKNLIGIFIITVTLKYYLLF